MGRLNGASSQVWAAFLVLGGLAAFGIACVCHVADVRSAILSAGTGLIGGGIAMFQHDAKSEKELPR